MTINIIKVSPHLLPFDTFEMYFEVSISTALSSLRFAKDSMKIPTTSFLTLSSGKIWNSSL